MDEGEGDYFGQGIPRVDGPRDVVLLHDHIPTGCYNLGAEGPLQLVGRHRETLGCVAEGIPERGRLEEDGRCLLVRGETGATGIVGVGKVDVSEVEDGGHDGPELEETSLFWVMEKGRLGITVSWSIPRGNE